MCASLKVIEQHCIWGVTKTFQITHPAWPLTTSNQACTEHPVFLFCLDASAGRKRRELKPNQSEEKPFNYQA